MTKRRSLNTIAAKPLIASATIAGDDMLALCPSPGRSTTLFSGRTATTAASNIAAGGAAAAVGSADEVFDRGELMVDRLLRGGAAAPEGASVPDQRAEVSRILLSSAASGTLDPADREYLVGAVATRTGIAPEEAQQRVDQIYAQAQELEAEARAAAERARKTAVIAAFMTAASLLIGGVGAYFGAVLGGNHRDNKVVVEGWVRPWR